MIPDSDRSMLHNGDRPVAFNPHSELQRDYDERRAVIEREIEELRIILSRIRRRDD